MRWVQPVMPPAPTGVQDSVPVAVMVSNFSTRSAQAVFCGESEKRSVSGMRKRSFSALRAQTTISSPSPGGQASSP